MHFKKQHQHTVVQGHAFHENLNFRDCCQRYFLSLKPQDKPQATRSLFFAELLLLYGQSILIRTAIQLFPGYLTVKKPNQQFIIEKTPLSQKVETMLF